LATPSLSDAPDALNADDNLEGYFMISNICKTAVAALCVMSGPALADWSTSAVSLGHTAPGATGQVECPPGGTPGLVWGTGTYTSDSSICGAAQHYGWFPTGSGGTVNYTTVPGLQSYQGSNQNGVTTSDYGAWGLSFQITGYSPPSGGYQQITWNDTIDSLGHGGSPGVTYRYACAPNNAPPATIWGVGPYTSDSPICVAAQHFGLINPGGGGNVTVIVQGPQQSYGSSSRYGVTSLQYPAWDRSYSFR